MGDASRLVQSGRRLPHGAEPQIPLILARGGAEWEGPGPMRMVLWLLFRLGALALAVEAHAAPPDAVRPVQQRQVWGMVEIAQAASPGTQILTMLSGPYADATQCEIFRATYTNDRAKAGDRIVSTQCGTADEAGAVFALLMRGPPFPVIVFEDGINLMAIGNAAMTPAQLAGICGQIRAELRRGTCHVPGGGAK
jgi:hypothetical protein